jgi:hypothetical protein
MLETPLVESLEVRVRMRRCGGTDFGEKSRKDGKELGVALNTSRS